MARIHYGPIVQNLTKLLANVTLKLLSRNMTTILILLLKKSEILLIFLKQKKINVFESTLHHKSMTE